MQGAGFEFRQDGNSNLSIKIDVFSPIEYINSILGVDFSVNCSVPTP
jgi:hypothetical protein